MKKVDAILVGIGGYGLNYLREMLDDTMGKINLVGAVDPYAENCLYINEVKERNIPVYPNMDSFYAEHTADLAVISTPILFHTENIITALKNGSHVLCEKPLCADEEEVARIIEARDENGKFVYIGFQRPYSSAITKLKADILAGKYGEMKSMRQIAMRPRGPWYYGRGIGWAGKLRTADGKAVYDSVANNAEAHYLFEMFYLMGELNEAKTPENVSAELMRVNDIENFDTVNMQFTLKGKPCMFLASHATEKEIEPVFEYLFENGVVYYGKRDTEWAHQLLPEDYTEYGFVVGYMNDGERIVYGDPMAEVYNKLYAAVDAVLEGRCDNGPCGVETAAVQTYVINKIQKENEILTYKKDMVRYFEAEYGHYYGEGLYERLLDIYYGKADSIRDLAQ